ncbi:paraquat-inducible protein A [Pseudoroseomonas globiformis]|uniref:Paraquat-inducible protein A n=1 Tax=Teichococcus globiformis TaxID=2307229 RepID=A0ABV7FZU5_9PROT
MSPASRPALACDAAEAALSGGTGLARQCHDCGMMLRLHPQAVGVDSRCPRCGAVLRRHHARPLDAPFALALASLMLCAMSLSMPFLTLRLLGQVRGSRIESGASAFAEDGLWLLAIVVVVTLVLVPLARLMLRLTVLGGLHLRHPPPWLGPRLMIPALRWHGHLGAWTMLEVFLFGALVSYTRLVDLAEVELGPAVYGLGAVVLALVAADAMFEPQAAWDAMEARGMMAPHTRLARPGTARSLSCHSCRRVTRAPDGAGCPRCGATLHHRKPNSVARSWALLFAAAVLYIPSNYYPVMNIITLGRGGPHTILGGVVEFVHTGFWPLALIVFLASVAVPMLKLVGLGIMLMSIRRRSTRNLRRKTQLYRVVEALGRWSMIDVFVVSVLIALVRFGAIASIHAEVGAACFGAVVILTMIAAECFDPRLMWDAAGANEQEAARPR